VVGCGQWLNSVGPKEQPHLSPGDRRVEPAISRALQCALRRPPDQLSHPAAGVLAANVGIPSMVAAKFCDRGGLLPPGDLHQRQHVKQEQALASTAGKRARNWNQKAAADTGADPTAQQVLASRRTYHAELRPAKTAQNTTYYRCQCGRDQRLNQIWGSKLETSVEPWPEQKS